VQQLVEPAAAVVLPIDAPQTAPRESEVAEPLQRLGTRRIERAAAGHEVAHGHVDVERELRVDVLVHAPPREREAERPPQAGDAPHAQAVSSTLKTASA